MNIRIALGAAALVTTAALAGCSSSSHTPAPHAHAATTAATAAAITQPTAAAATAATATQPPQDPSALPGTAGAIGVYEAYWSALANNDPQSACNLLARESDGEPPMYGACITELTTLAASYNPHERQLLTHLVIAKATPISETGTVLIDVRDVSSTAGAIDPVLLGGAFSSSELGRTDGHWQMLGAPN